ncbi:MAG: DUF4476 domain-containing protein [Chitinophagaceae bacterium]|nr:DUF4476 domain-containing protein [Chitinophagaceae bacterium]
MCKTAFSLFIFLAFYDCAYSQQGNYLYIDADKGQLFYVKLNDKVYSSSKGGYIIIPGITDNSSELGIGFPGNSFPEQRFSVLTNKMDQGFHLKNQEGNGWELQELITGVIIRSSNPQKATENTSEVRKNDAFSLMLSRVVNDPAVLIASSTLKEQAKNITAPVVAKPEPEKLEDTLKTETAPKVATLPAIAPELKVDTLVVTLNEPVTGNSKALPTTGPVRKLFDQQFEKVYEATYIDKNDGKTDTVRISYPINMGGSIETKPSAIQTPVAEPISNITTNGLDTSATLTTSIATTSCRLIANEQDLDNLRVKVLDAKTTDDKIAACRTSLLAKCYTVKQIKGLSELFPADEDKFRLFDLAYPFTSDSSAFPLLANLLKEDYYKKRFKTIIRK